MRRWIALTSVLLVATACASSASPDEPVLLRVAMADDWASAPAVGEVVDEFQRDHPHVRVEIQPSPFSQVPDVVTSGLEVDQPYDLAHWHAFAAAASGIAEPLDDLWAEHGLRADEYLDGAVQDVTWNETRYGVPLDTNALVLLVDRPSMEAAGVDVEDLAEPEAFVDVSQRLVDGSEAEHAISVSASSWTAYGWIRAHGGHLIAPGGDSERPTFTFDDPRTVQAIEMLVQLIDRELAPSPFAPDLTIEAVQAFAQGSAAMHATGSWDLPVSARAPGFDVEDIEVLPLPGASDDSATVLGGSSLFIPEGARNPDLAFELALRLTSDDVALRLAEQEGRLPARQHVFEDELFHQTPDMEAFVEQLPDAEVMPLIAYPEVASAFREGLESSLAGRRSPEAAMDEVQQFAQRWLEERSG